jgi:hypothetical protein
MGQYDFEIFFFSLLLLSLSPSLYVNSFLNFQPSGKGNVHGSWYEQKLSSFLQRWAVETKIQHSTCKV